MISSSLSHSSLASICNRWMREAEERKAWAAANPEIAAAWDEALAVEEQNAKAAVEAEFRARFVSEMAGRLVDMGAPVRASEAILGEMRAAPEARRYAKTEATAAVEEFIASQCSMLVMFGGVGSGKTCAAVGALAQCKTTLYAPEEIIWDTSKGRFIRAAEAARLSRFDDSEKWDELLRVRWLVLDDLGVENVNDYWRERINELMDVRYGNKLRTIITCNLSPDEFKTKYGDRIASRIREDGMVAGCGSTDFRRNPL